MSTQEAHQSAAANDFASLKVSEHQFGPIECHIISCQLRHLISEGVSIGSRWLKLLLPAEAFYQICNLMTGRLVHLNFDLWRGNSKVFSVHSKSISSHRFDCQTLVEEGRLYTSVRQPDAQ
jgi:hypothetical protein